MLSLSKFNLENGKSYIGHGNLFTKSIFFQNLKNPQILIFTQTKNIIENYEKIFSFLDKSFLEKFINFDEDFQNNSFLEITNNSDLAKLFFENNGNFIIDIDTANSLFIDFYKLQNQNSLKIEKGKKYSTTEIAENFAKFSYKFSDYYEKGSLKKTGDIFEIRDLKLPKVYQISFFGDEVENIFEYEVGNGEKYENPKEISEFLVSDLKDFETSENGNFVELVLNYFPGTIILDELDFWYKYELFEGKKNVIFFDNIENDSRKQIDLNTENLNFSEKEELKKLILDEKNEINFFTKKVGSLENFLSEECGERQNVGESFKPSPTEILNNSEDLNPPNFSIKTPPAFQASPSKREGIKERANIKIHEIESNLFKSFKIGDNLFISDDNLGKLFTKKRFKKSVARYLDLLLNMEIGDYVVHLDHGIGIFRDIIVRELGNLSQEYIQIDYSGEDKLFVPISEIQRISKYIGAENPDITPLSGTIWEKRISKAKHDAHKMAIELLDLYAKRKNSPAESFKIFEKELKEFQADFPYEYTNDQLIAIDEILGDLKNPLPMDRLLAGDVGFGKTEIAFNAIYNAILNGKQAVLISPLVVLAYEHYEKAKERFLKYGINVGVLTRLETASEVKKTIEDLKTGKIDLLIGTHKALSKEIIYKDLGFLVVDEEHKFGVSDKEKIKEIRESIDTLSMSATPIPRTLHLAISGFKQFSVLKTPPSGRKSVKTQILKFDEEFIKNVGEKEFERNGQIFFIHNRVENIEVMKNILQKIFPERKIIITHGQLSGFELEKRIIDFKNKKADILLSTTVIENGIDFPNVNTIFINECQNFGISQIHQLRGRVGRSDKQGFCFLLFRNENISQEATKRLSIIAKYSSLGSGFELAMRDLEIRGSGDILGIRQSGQNSDIGITLFLELLEEKVNEIKKEVLGEIIPEKSEKTIVDLKVSSFISDKFFSSDSDKINFYREVDSISTIEDIKLIENEFKLNSHYFSQNDINFFNILKLQILAKTFGISKIKKAGINYQIEFETGKLDGIKKFLNHKSSENFRLEDGLKLRNKIKNFKNDEMFIELVLEIVSQT